MIKTFSLLSSLFLCNSAYAVYTVNDAVNDAKLHNKELVVLEKNLDVKKLDRYKAASGFWPTVSAQAAYNNDTFNALDRQGNVAQSLHDAYENNALQVQHELFAGGRTIAQMKIANSSINAGTFEYNAKVANVFLKIIDAYHGVILARRVHQISINNEEGMRNRLEQIKTRFKVGELTKTDVSWAKYRLADSVAKREKAFGDVKTAESNFAYIIGQQPGDDLIYVDASKISLPKDFERFAAAVKTSNFDIKIAEEQLSASRSAVAVAASQLMPNVSAQFTVAENPSTLSNPTRSKKYAIQFSIPIFNPSLYVGVKEAKYKARSSEAALGDTLGSIDQNAVHIWNQTQVAMAQINSMREAVIAAQDALTSVQQEYKIGTKTTLDLLDSEQNLYDAQINQEKVNKDLVISSFQMKALMGELHKFDFKTL